MDPQSTWQSGPGALRVCPSRRTKSGITLSPHLDLNRPLCTQTIQQAVSLRPCYSALVFLVSSTLSIPIFISRETRVAWIITTQVSESLDLVCTVASPPRSLLWCQVPDPLILQATHCSGTQASLPGAREPCKSTTLPCEATAGLAVILTNVSSSLETDFHWFGTHR